MSACWVVNPRILPFESLPLCFLQVTGWPVAPTNLLVGDVGAIVPEPHGFWDFTQRSQVANDEQPSTHCIGPKFPSLSSQAYGQRDCPIALEIPCLFNLAIFSILWWVFHAEGITTRAIKCPIFCATRAVTDKRTFYTRIVIDISYLTPALKG